MHSLVHIHDSEYKVFLYESLQNAFPNNVLISQFQDECNLSKQSLDERLEERGGVSRALSHLKQNDTIWLVRKRAGFDRLKGCFLHY